jgi:hypothetical protein
MTLYRMYQLFFAEEPNGGQSTMHNDIELIYTRFRTEIERYPRLPTLILQWDMDSERGCNADKATILRVHFGDLFHWHECHKDLLLRAQQHQHQGEKAA